MLPSPPLIGTTYPIQSYGVVLFFILSGFLVALSTISKPDHDFRSYICDRFARIYTAFVPALLLVVFFDFVVISGERTAAHSFKTFVANLLMLQHTPFGRMIEGMPHFEPFGSARQFWTVPVEWWLYMLFGIVLFSGRSTMAERLLMGAAFVPAALVVGYFCIMESIGLLWLVGAAVAFAFFNHRGKTYLGLPLAVFLFFVVALAARFHVIDIGAVFNVYDIPFMFLTAAAFFAGLLFIPQAPWVRAVLSWSRPLWRWLAWISYSLYLTHQSLHYAFHARWGVSGWDDLALLMALSILVAWAFTFLFDRHHKSVATWLKRRTAALLAR